MHVHASLVMFAAAINCGSKNARSVRKNASTLFNTNGVISTHFTRFFIKVGPEVAVGHFAQTTFLSKLVFLCYLRL